MEQNIPLPMALKQLVNELSHSGKSQYNGLLFPVPVRLQVNLYGMVEALTHHAGTSRNKLMNQLIDVGIQATLAALPEDIVNQLEERSQNVVTTATEKNAGLMERGEA
jgi:hypothetical protein